MGSKEFLVYYILFYVVIREVKTVWCLKINDLIVPKRASHEASLDCRYSLEPNETLYDVKWYKDGFEFFRCMSDGRTIQFPAEGVKLFNSSELAKFGSCPLTLIGLYENTTGEYACEVSIEFTFSAETKRSHLYFVNSSLIENNRLEFIKGAQFVKYSENMQGFLANNTNAFLFQPYFSAILLLLIVFVNKLVKN